MLDISDGLAGDLRHILEAGRVGAELIGAAGPRQPRGQIARAGPGARGRNPRVLAALTDGEDFELLFTWPAGTQ